MSRRVIETNQPKKPVMCIQYAYRYSDNQSQRCDFCDAAEPDATAFAAVTAATYPRLHCWHLLY